MVVLYAHDAFDPCEGYADSNTALNNMMESSSIIADADRRTYGIFSFRSTSYSRTYECRKFCYR